MGRNARQRAQKKQARELAERSDAKRRAEAAARSPTPAKKICMKDESPEDAKRRAEGPREPGKADAAARPPARAKIRTKDEPPEDAKKRAERPPEPGKAEAPEDESPNKTGSKTVRHAPRLVPQPARCKLVLGARSSEDRSPEELTWTCSDCNKVNLPRRGLVADIPVLQCQCGRESEIEFDFSLANVTINDQKPIIGNNVKRQEKKDCVLCATASNMEITLQMRAILSGEKFKGKETVIDLKALKADYESVRTLPDVNKDARNDKDNITVLAAIAKYLGVITDVKKEPKLNKLPEYVKVNGSFYDIVRVLADGHPLTSALLPGKNFEKLKPGQIYKAPRREKLIPGKHSEVGHAILLVGAGRKGNTNYYHFLNSWGKTFCLEEDGRYGFGMLRASDIIIQPVKFIRYGEEVEYHKMLASTDLSSLG